MSKLYNDSVQVASEKIQWQRDDVAAKIVDFQQARDKQSQRQFAIEQHGPLGSDQAILLIL